MKFEEDKFLATNQGVTRKLEGGISWIFAQRALSKQDIDCSNCHFLEIGPKHGLHTLGIDMYKPKSITCVDAPNKIRSIERKSHENRDQWVSQIKTENLKSKNFNL